MNKSSKMYLCTSILLKIADLSLLIMIEWIGPYVK